MCGRYFISPDEPEMQKILNDINANDADAKVKRGEIFPTNSAPMLYNCDGTLLTKAAVWGYPGFRGSGVLINARAETAPEKRTFRESLFTRRCIIPCTGFYEWDKRKQKFLFRLPAGNMLYLAGLFNEYGGERRFVILTGGANDSVSDIHNRMPVILPRHSLTQWATDTDFALRYLHEELPQLSREIVQ